MAFVVPFASINSWKYWVWGAHRVWNLFSFQCWWPPDMNKWRFRVILGDFYQIDLQKKLINMLTIQLLRPGAYLLWPSHQFIDQPLNNAGLKRARKSLSVLFPSFQKQRKVASNFRGSDDLYKTCGSSIIAFLKLSDGHTLSRIFRDMHTVRMSFLGAPEILKKLHPTVSLWFFEIIFGSEIWFDPLAVHIFALWNASLLSDMRSFDTTTTPETWKCSLDPQSQQQRVKNLPTWFCKCCLFSDSLHQQLVSTSSVYSKRM